MSYREINKKKFKPRIKSTNNANITICILILLIIFFASLTLIKITNEIKIDKTNISYFYLDVIENTSSAIKSYSKDSKEKQSTTFLTKIG